MKETIIKQASALLLGIAALAITGSAFAEPPKDSKKETMCVKQSDGTYKCIASGTTMKEPCCEVPKNEDKPKPKQ